MSSSYNSNLSRGMAPPPPPSPPPPPIGSNRERRTWTSDEEDALTVILKKLVVDGWRQENAFRTGYLDVIEKEMRIRFPGTDLTSTNAMSKLTVWKRHYYQLLNMINTSGFGWNDSSNMIIVDNDDVWQQYVKVHSQVKAFRFKSFRHFKDWIDIFGKDRATGKSAQGPEDLAKVATEEPYIPHFDPYEFPVDSQNDSQFKRNEEVDNEFTYNNVLVEEEVADTPSPDECNSHSVNINKRDGGKKIKSTRKRSRLETTSKEPIIVDLMDKFFKQQNESIGIFVDKLDKRGEHSTNNKPEAVDKTKLVLEALSKIGTLTEENRLYFAYKITTDASVMDLFLNFSEGERITFVNMMLAGKVLP
ncbi:hypothetical protein OROGR_010226 [Orobanche gracilis]